MNKVSDNDIRRIIDASYDTVMRTLVAEKVGIKFKSVHYMSSRRITDAVVLNLTLNDKITPNSADEIITALRRTDRSLYTTVESALNQIMEKFDTYAKEVLGDEYDKIAGLKMRAVNYIVFVISTDMKNDRRISGTEVINRAYTYAEILEGNIPHY